MTGRVRATIVVVIVSGWAGCAGAQPEVASAVLGGVELRPAPRVGFQLPPLAQEPAGDTATWLSENVRPVLRVGLRVRLW